MTTGQICTFIIHSDALPEEKDFATYAKKKTKLQQFEEDHLYNLYQKYRHHTMTVSLPMRMSVFELRSLKDDLAHLLRKRGINDADRIEVFESYQVTTAGKGLFADDDKQIASRQSKIRRSKRKSGVPETSGEGTQGVQENKKPRASRKRG